MKKTIQLSISILALTFAVRTLASSPEPKLIMATYCDSGSLNPQNKLKADVMTSEPGMQYFAKLNKGTYQVRAQDVLVRIPVNGSDESYCLNNGSSTFFNLVISK